MDTPRKNADASGAGRRFSRGEALELAGEAGLHDLCEAGLRARLARFGHKAYYVYNQHLNFTNVCRNACRFCAFSKRAGEAGAYAMDLKTARSKIESRLGEPIREIHIVGGLNPELPYDYYLDLVETAKTARPDAVVKAFTAVEVAHLADTYGIGDKRVLSDLRSAGLGMLPGGGAEVFAPELRAILCPEKVTGARWLAVHETAHELGIPTNATMLFGHIENWEQRIDHLLALRDLQDKTGGFNCFIPLPYQPGGNPLAAKGPDGVDLIRLMAVSRLALDNIPHLKAYWVYCGVKAAQMALWAGADDFDGTLIEENIGHAAGADTPKGLTVAELKQYIAAAGFTPVERDTFFNEV
ncbi:MAG: CofH family radical SAM protein [Desulfovibrionaceae bacterium]|nr:CofH family radical SAM protein [Desulfovibrionaceae bacterium]MBF0513852.1 CofH family radical SAM protein [Desulfovibrionaceae bacterium]